MNQFEHPVVLFDCQSWPVLLNTKFQELILNQSPVASSGHTVSSIWKSACESAARIMLKYVHSESETEIAESFQVHDTTFIILGHLLRTPAGKLFGSVVNLTESHSVEESYSLIFGNRVAGALPVDLSGRVDYTEEDFHSWMVCRENARSQIAVLSPRETQVVALVADGQSNKTIAATLGVTTKTIEKHRSNAVLKLGVGSSAELVRISVLAGQKTTVPALSDVARN